MKRDMELVRKILFEMEDLSHKDDFDLAKFEDYEEEQVHYHLMIMHQAGLIQAIDATAGGGLEWIPEYITWQGHEFLDAARNDTTWQKARSLTKNVGGVTFDVLKQLLISWGSSQLGLPG